LLNGRNKKVSDEVIGKIHRAYPTLNVMWLMFGDGEMLMSGSTLNGAADNLSEGTTPSESMMDDLGQRAISFDDDEPGGYRQTSKPAQRVATPSLMNETIQSIMRSTAAGRAPQRGGTSTSDRRVVKMLVFYSDGRFEEFGPTQ